MRYNALQLPDLIVVRENEVRISARQEHPAGERELTALGIEVRNVLVVLRLVLQPEYCQRRPRILGRDAIQFRKDPRSCALEMRPDALHLRSRMTGDDPESVDVV